jgi:predicted DNA-binding protein with PD1-like motif
VELAYFDIESKQYEKIPVHEQVEVLSLLGDVTLSESKPKVHLHAVLGRRDGSTRGGHLIKGLVRPTLEVVLTESPVHLRRKFDPEVGLALIEPDLR